MTGGFQAVNEQMGMEYRDQWTTAYVNALPDSAFLYIAPGGTKTDGRTDGAHRYFPVKDASGKVDVPHLKNALARIPQASSIPASARETAMTKAKAMMAAHPDTGSGTTKEYEGTAGSGRAREHLPAETEYRSLTFELRSEGPDGRTLIGRAVPYGPTTTLPDGRLERFMPGAFAHQVAAADQWGQVRVFDAHSSRIDGRQALGKTTLLGERPDGLYGEWHIYGTHAGDDALELVRTGEVTGLSIGFKPKSTKRGSDGALERHTASLDHIALTTEPAYADATITGLRSQSTSRPAGSFRRDLDVALGILARLRAGA